MKLQEKASKEVGTLSFLNDRHIIQTVNVPLSDGEVKYRMRYCQTPQQFQALHSNARMAELASEAHNLQ